MSSGLIGAITVQKTQRCFPQYAAHVNGSCGSLLRVTSTDPLVTALVAEAAKKSAMLWLQPADQDHATAAWHVWLDGSAYVVSGGLEQALPPLAGHGPVTVTVRSKDKGARLVTWVADPAAIEVGSAEWDLAATELQAKRLNSPDGEDAPARWAAESTITRLVPTGEVPESPGAMSPSSHAAVPVASAATTRGPLPFMIGRRARRRR